MLDLFHVAFRPGITVGLTRVCEKSQTVHADNEPRLDGCGLTGTV